MRRGTAPLDATTGTGESQSVPAPKPTRATTATISTSRGSRRLFGPALGPVRTCRRNLMRAASRGAPEPRGVRAGYAVPLREDRQVPGRRQERGGEGLRRL